MSLVKSSFQHKISAFFVLFFAFLLTLFCVSEFSTNAMPMGTKSVLIMNSYSEGLSWTEKENEGILEKLKYSGEHLDISVEFMDWKVYPDNTNLKYLSDYMRYKYSKKYIDLIITTDDAALKFALEHRKELFDNAPVIFCGVNAQGVETLTVNEREVAGIIEEVDAEGTIRQALKINPDLRDIYVIFDNSESGVSTWELTKKSAMKVSSNINLIPLNKGGYEEILSRVEQAGKDSIILITTYYNDEEGNIIGFENFTKLISEASKVPVYHLYEFGLGHGAVGGSVLSGRVQGELAGELALRVLKGEDLSRIAVNDASAARFMFDYQVLQQFNISTDQLPDGSILINEPPSVFKEYRNTIVSISIVLILLVIFIFILLIYINKISNIKKELAKSHSELSELYEDLTTSDKELKRQYDELSTVKEELSSSEARYRQLYEKMLNGYVVFEPIIDEECKLKDLRFVELNPSFGHQTKRDISKLPGKRWREVFGKINIDQRIFQRVQYSGEVEQFEIYYADINTYYLVNAFKINSNQVGVVFENITNYKLAIEEVRKLNEELEERVIDRTRELQSAVSHLESFTHTVSHDLKSPLRAVESYIKIIMEDHGKHLNIEVQEMLSCVKNISTDMIELVNKLLLFSKTSRSELNIEETNIEDKFKDCFNELKVAYPDRNIELIIETGLPLVMADRILLRQVIHNILSNSFKFTKERAQAQIRVGSTLTENEYVFYVKDNGIGFDMKYSGKLFGIFQRLHTSDEFEGSGIGLVTIKSIIEKHGGRTWIEGETGVGTTIYFTIPYRLNPKQKLL